MFTTSNKNKIPIKYYQREIKHSFSRWKQARIIFLEITEETKEAAHVLQWHAGDYSTKHGTVVVPLSVIRPVPLLAGCCSVAWCSTSVHCAVDSMIRKWRRGKAWCPGRCSSLPPPTINSRSKERLILSLLRRGQREEGWRRERCMRMKGGRPSLFTDCCRAEKNWGGAGGVSLAARSSQIPEGSDVTCCLCSGRTPTVTALTIHPIETLLSLQMPVTQQPCLPRSLSLVQFQSSSTQEEQPLAALPTFLSYADLQNGIEENKKRRKKERRGGVFSLSLRTPRAKEEKKKKIMLHALLTGEMPKSSSSRSFNMRSLNQQFTPTATCCVSARSSLLGLSFL